jgi:predicted nucleotidyltransferase
MAAKSGLEKLAAKVAKKLVGIDGVVAVTLGGSTARGAADAASDVDLGVYYRAENKPHVERFRELAKALDDDEEPLSVTDFGDWGPWINGGAWLRIDGTRVDWLYRELGHVVQTISDCRAGRVGVDYQPGHPHGWNHHVYMGEIAECAVLQDPAGVLAAMKKLASEYPEGLRRGLVERHLWEASFTLETVAKSPKRGDVAYVAGALYRCTAGLVQVIYALNRRYFLNEKGSVAAASAMKLAPKGFEKRVEDALGKTGSTAAQLAKSVETLRELVQDVRALSA